MSSEVVPDDVGAPELRLHPLSWLFILLGQLKQFALPLLVLLITGQRDNYDLWGLIAVGVLAAVSIVRYFTYRYRIEADGLAIRSGLLQRNLRYIPFGRIQNVTLHQNLLHRLFGVAEVQLDSAGAPKPEAQMRVLRLDAARQLELLIRTRESSNHAAPMAEPVTPPLFTMPLGEVLLLGLINNRGVWVIGGLFALLAQTGGNLLGGFFTAFATWFSGEADSLHLTTMGRVAAALALLLIVIAALRVLSVALAVLHFYGFSLRDSNGRLSIEQGLLTRVRASVPRHRIQAYSLKEGLLHRLFHRQSLRVDTAVLAVINQGQSLQELVPLARSATMTALLSGLLPSQVWPILQWSPLHPRAWRRKFTLPALLALSSSLVLAYFRGPAALFLLALLPILLCRAHLWARRSAYSVDNGLIAFRGGWLNRHWRFAESRKLQALELLQSPFDRYHGMATLRLDTAGVGAMEQPLQIPYLPVAIARQLYELLSEQLRTRAVTPARTAVSATPIP